LCQQRQLGRELIVVVLIEVNDVIDELNAKKLQFQAKNRLLNVQVEGASPYHGPLGILHGC